MARNEYTFDQLPQEKRREIARNGAKASNKAKKVKKEQLKQRKTIVETLKDVLYSRVTNKNLIQMLEKNGIEGEQNYLVAMISAAILKGVQKGNLIDIMKLIEVLEGSAAEKIEVTNMDKTVLELETYLAKKKRNEQKS